MLKGKRARGVSISSATFVQLGTEIVLQDTLRLRNLSCTAGCPEMTGLMNTKGKLRLEIIFCYFPEATNCV